MHVWLLLLVPSALIGVLCALFIRGKKALYLAGAIPWLGLLCALIYTVYLAPNADGGDGLWIIAQVFGGAIAAGVGIAAFRVTRKHVTRDGV